MHNYKTTKKGEINMKQLEIEVGQEAVAIASGIHSFKDGEQIKFVKYGRTDEEKAYYEYLFEGEKGKMQLLVSKEFKLKEVE